MIFNINSTRGHTGSLLVGYCMDNVIRNGRQMLTSPQISTHNNVSHDMYNKFKQNIGNGESRRITLIKCFPLNSNCMTYIFIVNSEKNIRNSLQ